MKISIFLDDDEEKDEEEIKENGNGDEDNREMDPAKDAIFKRKI